MISFSGIHRDQLGLGSFARLWATGSNTWWMSARGASRVSASLFFTNADSLHSVDSTAGKDLGKSALNEPSSFFVRALSLVTDLQCSLKRRSAILAQEDVDRLFP